MKQGDRQTKAKPLSDAPPVKFRDALSRTDIVDLMFVALRNTEVYGLLASADPQPEWFGCENEDLWHIWSTCHNFHRKFRRLPNNRELRLALNANVIHHPVHPATDELLNEINKFLDKLRTMEEDEFLKTDVATTFAKRFIKDAAWKQLQKISRIPNLTPTNIGEVYKPILEQVAIADSHGKDGHSIPFPKDYEKKHVISTLVPFGVDFIDKYLGGGGAPGEVYCLLGPYGSCKTTLLQQLSISLAQLQSHEWETENQQCSMGLSYFVSYEMTEEVLQYRAIANVAEIPFDVLFNHQVLSRSNNLNDRDRELFSEHIARGWHIPGEHERKKAAECRLNHCWRILDFTGQGTTDESVGGGLWDEIRTKINGNLQWYENHNRRVHVAGIFIDYLGVMARRHCFVNDLDITEHVRSTLVSSIGEIRRKLAHHFRCPVVVAHQLNAKGNQLKPGVLPKMTQAAESNTVSENCDFVFVIAKVNDKGLTRIECQKHRRMKGLGPIVLQVHGEYARVEDVSAVMVFDDASKQYILKSEYDRGEPYHSRRKTSKSSRPSNSSGFEITIPYE